MKNVVLEDHGAIAVLRLANGVTNAIGPLMVAELSAALREVKGRFRGLVLAGGNKFFSIGLELPVLLKLSPPEMTAFWVKFEDTVLDLYTLPVPTAAAIAGHANGGGAILSLACDFRFIAAGRKLLSLNEVKIGLPVPYLADLLLRQIAGDRIAVKLEFLSEFLAPEAAQAAGLADAVCPEEEVEALALSQVQTVVDLPPFGFPMTKRHRVNPLRSQFLAERQEITTAFMDLWAKPQVQQLLGEAAKKF
jgi:enoyl-CoA hydratase/carnithine racemase